MPRNKNLKELSKEKRKESTLGEIIMWKKLRNKQFLGLDFDRQRLIGSFVVDFYCPSKRVIIEVDGDSHRSKEYYDKARHECLESLNLRVIHISDYDVKTNMPAVLKKLETFLNGSN